MKMEAKCKQCHHAYVKHSMGMVGPCHEQACDCAHFVEKMKKVVKKVDSSVLAQLNKILALVTQRTE